MAAHDEVAERVIDANQRCYNALQASDFELMTSVWEKSERITCVHPDGTIERGWPAIRSGWQQIFRNYDRRSEIILSNVAVAITNNIAWVTLDSDVVIGDDAFTFATTNMFARHGTVWLLVAHHASPIRRDLGT